MPKKKPGKSGKSWTKKDDKQLDKLIKENTPTGLMAWKLDRSKKAVYSHAAKRKKSVKPTNKSPYNRRKRR